MTTMTKAKVVTKIFSADDHVNEPPDLWTSRLPKAMHERGPHVVRDPKKGDCWVVEGNMRGPITMSALAGRKFEEFVLEGLTYDTIRRGGFDPVARMADMDIDGLEGTVIYGGGMAIGIQDKALRLASIKAYNDWLAAFCAVNPKRLAGAAMLPVTDPEEVAGELRRTAKMGIKGALVEFHRMAKPLGDPVFKPLWAMAQELGVPLSFHIGGVRGMTYTDTAPGSAEAFMAIVPMQHDEILATIIFSGILQEFPRLKIVMAEGGIGWLPYLMERMDISWRRRRHSFNSVVKTPPSEFVKRNVWASFMEDKVGIMLRHVLGVDKIMWSSDYPHGDTTWPDSLKYIDDHFKGIPEAETRKIIHDNTVQVFNI